MEGQRKIYDTFMLNYVWLDYIVLENDEIKKNIFCGPTCPMVVARWAAMLGTLGDTLYGGKKLQKKKIFF